MALEIKTIRCKNCGAQIFYDASKQVLKCEFCGSEYLPHEEKPLTEELKADKILTFKIEESSAIKIFEKWITRGFWQPKDLAREFRRTGAKGIYIPCWHFSFSVNTYWYGQERREKKGEGKIVGGKREAVTVEEWIPRSGSRTESYSLFVPASGGLSMEEVNQLAQFPLEESAPFSSEYFLGKQGEIPVLSRDSAWEKAKEEAISDEKSYAESQVDRLEKFDINFSEPASTLIYVPIWVFGYKYHGKYYRTVINGRTGEIYGKKPISKLKVAIAILIPAVVVGVVVLLTHLF